MIRLGVIGTGGMAHHHARSFQKIKGVHIVACCDVSKERVVKFADDFKVPAVYTDYRDMLVKENLDAITNVTIDAMHAPISIAAMQKGIHVLCEKPLGTTLAEARKMVQVAKKTKVINMVNFSYRNSSGLQAAKIAIEQGKIGKIMHVESSYLQCWLSSTCWGDWRTSPAWLWRLSTRHGSAGVLGDIGCHIMDLTTFLCGDIGELYGQLKTFDKGVPGNRKGEYVFDANDSFVANVTFKNGALGTIHSSRWATGHQNSLRARVYGDKGAIEVDLDRSYTEYRIVTGKKAVNATEWKTVTCKPTPSNFQRFIKSIQTGHNDVPDFETGMKIQAYIENSFKSNEQKYPIKITF